jgi:hypothetical protein
MGVFPSGGRLREIVLEVDIPDVLAELEAAFEAYGRGLTGNEIELSGARLAGTSAVAANAHQTWQSAARQGAEATLLIMAGMHGCAPRPARCEL